MTGTPKRARSILIVDDEVDAVKMAALLVKDLWPDAIIATAHDGDEAIRKAFDHQPDLVLTDIRMPGPSGIELVRMLREAVSSGTTKVVVWTGFHDEKTRKEALLIGADAYLTKPVDAPTLRSTLSKLLSVALLLVLLSSRAFAGAKPEEGTYAWHRDAALAATVRNDLETAEREWRLAKSTLRENDPARLFVIENIGAVAMQQGDLREARKNFDRAIEFGTARRIANESLIHAYLGLAYCLTRDRSLDLAIKTYSAAFRLTRSRVLREMILQRMEALAIDW